MRYLILFSFLLCSVAFGQVSNHCKKFDSQPRMAELIKDLSAKLSYEVDEFCTNSRIADIFSEEKLVYHREDDQYHPYEFVTIHYYEYSCEYQYSWDEKKWADQYCYNTW